MLRNRAGLGTLLAARIVTGLFGGVVGSITMAIAADLFALEVRGRVIGIIQTAFASSQGGLASALAGLIVVQSPL